MILYLRNDHYYQGVINRELQSDCEEVILFKWHLLNECDHAGSTRMGFHSTVWVTHNRRCSSTRDDTTGRVEC
jgi:hypothetical protein